MGTDNVRRPDDEAVNNLEDCAVDGGMAEKVRAFREMSKRTRSQTPDRPQASSEVLIRQDRDSGHRDAWN